MHTFVNRLRYRGTTLEPGYTADNLPNPNVGPDVGLVAIDHVVGNVEQGKLDTWVDFYTDVMGFAQLLHFDDEQIRTEYSALMSTVVWDGSKIVMPINEPAEGLKKSQIQEYIEHYDGPGVQHIALRTDDIVATVQALRDRGVRFMTVPDTYYDEAKLRLAEFDLPWDELQRLNILADKDHDGYLLADLHRDDHRPPGRVLRDHRAPRRQGLRRGQLQGAVRGDRTRPGAGAAISDASRPSPDRSSIWPSCRATNPGGPPRRRWPSTA